MLGIDTDNDSAFMNQTVFDYCKDNGLEQTRSRAYRKNDQAWVEQKNGAVVRRLVGYGRLSGLTATQALAQLYAASRLYINFFQPSFKLKSKSRDGARVSKTYHAPATPCDRLLASERVTDDVKAKLRQQFDGLDPVALLRDIRSSQQRLSELQSGGAVQTNTTESTDVSTFLASLATAWKTGEVRPTHRKKPSTEHWWRTRTDPFEHAWPVIEAWLANEPTVTAKELMARLAAMLPEVYAGGAQLRTLQRRIKAWRAEKAKDLILGRIKSISRAPSTVETDSPQL
jgi:hypothetical protein